MYLLTINQGPAFFEVPLETNPPHNYIYRHSVREAQPMGAALGLLHGSLSKCKHSQLPLCICILAFEFQLEYVF